MRSPRRVIDVSGDGPNNAGALIDPIRQFLLAEGVTINGLPIALPRIGEADGFARYDPSRLQSYFERCVIGGPDAFAIAVTDAAMFVTAVRRKLVREISMNMDQVIYAAYTERSAPTVDCNMIGQLPGRWLERRGGTVDDNAFPSRINPRVHMSTRQYARLVDEWLEAIGLRPEEYGTHSLRRTKASIIYKATGNLRAIQILLGHTKIENTVRYLGVDVEDSLELRRQLRFDQVRLHFTSGAVTCLRPISVVADRSVTD